MAVHKAVQLRKRLSGLEQRLNKFGNKCGSIVWLRHTVLLMKVVKQLFLAEQFSIDYSPFLHKMEYVLSSFNEKERSMNKL